MRNMLIGLAALLAFPAAAAAECQPSLLPAPASVNFSGVSIGPGLSKDEPVSVTVRNTGDTPCSLLLRVSRGLTDVALSAPDYRLFGPAGEIEILPFGEAAGTTRSDIVVNIDAASRRTVPLTFRLATGWGLRAGRYSDQLRFMLIGGGGNEVDSRDLSLTINIPPTATLRLFGSSGGDARRARIDLRRLSSTRETRSDPFAVRIWSTAPYHLSFASENLGHLVHTNGVDRIPYELTMNSTSVDLVGASQFFFDSHTGASGDIHPLSLRVGPVRTLAGDYSDRVTIIVTAL